MLRRFALALFLGLCLAGPAAAEEAKTGNNPMVVMETSLGTVKMELFQKEAPLSVKNFLDYANSGYYDGTIFHRVIPNFMIQGGDPLGTGTGDPGYRFEDEVHPDDAFSKPGLLAMANAGPNTNGSQFFITEVPTPWLNGKHTIFGEVVKGQELVTKIVQAGNGKVKLEKVVITRGAQP